MQTCSSDCPVCHGLGFIRLSYESIHDPNFGKMFPCPESLKNFWDPQLGIDESESALLNWNTFRRSEAMTLMRNALTDLITRGYGWLYLWGTPGLGKTVASKASVIEAHYKHKKTARYLTHARMINFLRSSYDEENGQLTYQQA